MQKRFREKYVEKNSYNIIDIETMKTFCYNKTNLLMQVCNTQRVMPKYRWFEKSLFELMV